MKNALRPVKGSRKPSHVSLEISSLNTRNKHVSVPGSHLQKPLCFYYALWNRVNKSHFSLHYVVQDTTADQVRHTDIQLKRALHCGI